MSNIDDCALIVGINDYKDNQFVSLDGAVNDANNFEKWLLDPSGGDVPEAKITKFVSEGDDERPEFAEIEDAIGELVVDAIAAKPDPMGRRLYLFMSGHGITLGKLEECGLLTANASQTVPDRVVPGLKVAMAFKHGQAFDEVVLIMDCCREVAFNKLDKDIHSLGMLDPPGGDATLLRALAAKWDRDAGERLLEVPGGNGETQTQGLFAHAVLKGLRRGANDAGDVTGESLKTFVEAEMTRLAPDQKPEVIWDNDFVLCSPGPSFTNVHITVQDPSIDEFEIREGKFPFEVIDKPVTDQGGGTYEVDLSEGLYMMGWPPGNLDEYVGRESLEISGATSVFII
ncbi:MAG: caspase family protein [Actinomycetia bacterium]|nr:caspase family protein [Actinomycetes bacterium]